MAPRIVLPGYQKKFLWQKERALLELPATSSLAASPVIYIKQNCGSEGGEDCKPVPMFGTEEAAESYYQYNNNCAAMMHHPSAPMIRKGHKTGRDLSIRNTAGAFDAQNRP